MASCTLSFEVVRARQNKPPKLETLLTPSVRWNFIKPLPSNAHHIVFDTETTGVSLRAVVLQLAYVIYDTQGLVLQSYSELLKLPSRCTVTKIATQVHGFTTKDCKERGRCPLNTLKDFAVLLNAASKQNIPVIAHNVAFDQRMLQQTAQIHGLSKLYSDLLPRVPFLCLYKLSRKYSTHRTASGQRKGFKNPELFAYLYGEEPSLPLHDALHDVLVTGANYQGGVERGWW